MSGQFLALIISVAIGYYFIKFISVKLAIVLYKSYSNGQAVVLCIFMHSLCNLSSLKYLNFGGNQLTEEVAELLSSVITNNPAIKELYLGNNNLQAGIFKIAMALKKAWLYASKYWI